MPSPEVVLGPKARSPIPTPSPCSEEPDGRGQELGQGMWFEGKRGPQPTPASSGRVTLQAMAGGPPVPQELSVSPGRGLGLEPVILSPEKYK